MKLIEDGRNFGKKSIEMELTSNKNYTQTVSRMMGHTNIKTTQIYAKITKEKISQDMEVLSHKLAGLEKQITERI
jgi:integrase